MPSKKFFDILYRYTDRVEPYGIDEGWLDVTYSQKLFGSGLNIANCIINDLKKEMGITVSIGIYYRELVHKLPVEKLLFVGDKTKELFNVYGIRTITEVPLIYGDEKY